MKTIAICRDGKDLTGGVWNLALRQDVQPLQRYSQESLQTLRFETGAKSAAVVSYFLLFFVIAYRSTCIPV